MKTCAYCSTKVQEDEGRKDEEGNFVCQECLGDEAGAPKTTLCPECGETSDEFGKEGICPNCGHERGLDEEEDADASEASDEEEADSK